MRQLRWWERLDRDIDAYRELQDLFYAIERSMRKLLIKKLKEEGKI